MKIKISVALILAFTVLFQACKKHPSVPVINTLSVQNVKYFTANSGGLIADDGGSEVFLRGLCWSTHPNPTISDDTTVDRGAEHHFISELRGLTPASTYYVRAYAINSAGVGYGKALKFSTLTGTFPELITHQVKHIFSMQADVEGEVISDGGHEITERGICWGTEPYPTINTGNIAKAGSSNRFTTTITGLQPNTTYYTRAYAINQVGVGYGSQLEFTTPETEHLPVVLTNPVQKITQWSALVTGEIINEGGLPVSQKGICWDTTPNPDKSDNYAVDTSGSGFISVKMHSLKQVTTYYVRTFIVSAASIIYGNQLVFSTLAPGVACPESPTVSDIDGNVYQTVQIGRLCFFKANLKTTRFSDGSPIPYSDAFTNQPSYTWYNKDPRNKRLYGGLYNWHAVSHQSGLCPEGWRVPDQHDWNVLAAYAGNVIEHMNVPDGISVLKSTRTAPDPHPRWDAGGVPANDLLGFSALPAGVFWSHSWGYSWIGLTTYFWASDEYSGHMAHARSIWNSDPRIDITGSSKWGFMSVRCVRD